MIMQRVGSVGLCKVSVGGASETDGAMVLEPVAVVNRWNSLDFGAFVALHRRSRTPMGKKQP
jgi:hypothetical protein